MSVKKILRTSNVYSSNQAVENKMKQIHPKLFGLFCPVKYSLVSTEKVYVPYMLTFDKEGQIGIVYDMNEVHAFHYDLYDELALVESSVDSTEVKLLQTGCTEKEAIENSIECAKWQFLRKVFHAVPEITLAEKTAFYREAVKLNLTCRGKQYEKFAYLDMFGAKNEHISGLKVRLDV